MSPEDVPRCTAKSSRSGQQCRNRPMRGSTVCSTHGGSAPQVKAAAARRVVAAQVAQDAAAVIAHEGITGVEDPVELLSLVAAEIAAAKDAISKRVNALDSISVAGNPSQLRAEVSLWLQLLDRTTKSAEVLARLDLEGRRTSAAERWADEIQRLVQALLAGLELSPAQWERVPTVMSTVLGSRLELEAGEVS